jgi:hypothetical protein
MLSQAKKGLTFPSLEFEKQRKSNHPYEYHRRWYGIKD